MGGILHNMLYRVAAARQRIRDEGAVNVFQRFRDCSESMIACKALILQVNAAKFQLACCGILLICTLLIITVLRFTKALKFYGNV